MVAEPGSSIHGFDSIITSPQKERSPADLVEKMVNGESLLITMMSFLKIWRRNRWETIGPSKAQTCFLSHTRSTKRRPMFIFFFGKGFILFTQFCCIESWRRREEIKGFSGYHGIMISRGQEKKSLFFFFLLLWRQKKKQIEELVGVKACKEAEGFKV